MSEKFFVNNTRLLKLEKSRWNEITVQYKLDIQTKDHVYCDKVTNYILFTSCGKIIVLLGNNETFVKDCTVSKTIKFSEEKGWFSKDYLLHLNNEDSFHVESKNMKHLENIFNDFIHYIENTNSDNLGSEIEKYDDLINKLNIDEIQQDYDFYEIMVEQNSKINESIEEFLDDLSYVKREEDFLYSESTGRFKRIHTISKTKVNDPDKEYHGEERSQFQLIYLYPNPHINSYYIEFWCNERNTEFFERYYYFPFIPSLDEIPTILHMKNYTVFLSFEKFIDKIMTNNFIMDKVEFDKLLPIENFIRKLKSDIQKETKESKSEISKEMKVLDKDNNGIIDIIESDDFKKLLLKYESQIKEIDKGHVHKFVKLSNYLKKRRENIQSVFSSLSNEENTVSLIELFGVLKNQIHNYEVLTLHSINMIVSLIEGKEIVFYEIYESFDRLNVFNSNWENELSEKLTNIEIGLNEVMYSIQEMEMNIVKGLNQLSYITEESFKNLETSVTEELKNINSTIKFNNLLTGIQTYQMYKINKNTKSLN